MRLSGRGVRCVRGGREVFSGLDFESPPARRWPSPAANGSGKTSLLRLIAGLADAGRRLDRSRGRRGRTDAGPNRPIISATATRMKPALERAGKSGVLAGFSRRRGVRCRAKPRRGRARSCRRICRRPICRPDSGDGCRSPGCWRCGGRSGCWTSRPRRSIPPARACLPTLMRDHLARGGLIIAATHAPLGIAGRELRIGEGRER